MERKLKIYLASSWFTPATKEILGDMQTALSNLDYVDLYSPSRDGTMLRADELNNEESLRTVFEENISHITDADVVVANVYSEDPINDTGTMYEIGYAVANRVPVIGYSPVFGNISERFRGILNSLECVCSTIPQLTDTLAGFSVYQTLKPDHRKVLFIGNGDIDLESSIVSRLMDNNIPVRWVDVSKGNIYSYIDQLFEGIDYMIAVVDDKKTLVSWMMGQAYSRKVPIVTYTDHDYGVNVMLLASIVTHIKGMNDLDKFIRDVKVEGISGIKKVDISKIKSC